jgi:GxxExxY protein
VELAPEYNRLSGIVVDSALAVHRALGPGLLESVYEECLAYELRDRGLTVARQLSLPVTYRGVRIEAGFRIDLVVEDLIILEIKAAERLLSIHEAQLLTYLKLSGKRLGLLINFNVAVIKDGIRRIAH